MTVFQGCAVAEPGGFWCPTLAFRGQENFSFFSYKSYTRHPSFRGSENWALRASLAYYTELQHVGNLLAEMSEERQLYS